MKQPKVWIPLALLLVLVWFFRPFFHGIVMSFIVSPLQFVLIVLLVIGAVTAISRLRDTVKVIKVSSDNYRFEASPGARRSLGLYLVLFFLVLFGLFIQNEVRSYLTSRQITFEDRETLPTVDPIRLMPKSVAARYGQDSFQNPQEHLGDSQIVLMNGKLQRVFPRLPEGGLLYFFKKMSGFATVEVDTLDRKVSLEDQEFALSEGVGIFDNLHYRLPLKRYFVNYTNEPIYLKDDSGKWVTVVPYITYKGFPFTVPQWGGVMVVHADGSMQDYTPQEAQALSYLKGNRIHPKELAVYYANSYAYKGGILNKWFLHKNETQVVSLPGDEAVIHTATNDGFKQIIVAEPYGSSYGIYKIFLIDATTGKREVISFSQNSQLTGPVAAADYIKKEFPTFDWTAFSLAEPRPLVTNNKLYWLLSIIPNDSAGIANTVLLDTTTNNVTTVKTEAELKAFLAGKELPSTDQPAPVDTQQAIKQKIEAIENQLKELKALVQ
ncbi:MAG TPA: hypothetical protein VGE59_01160 [Patescibacteria group bacterium]